MSIMSASVTETKNPFKVREKKRDLPETSHDDPHASVGKFLFETGNYINFVGSNMFLSCSVEYCKYRENCQQLLPLLKRLLYVNSHILQLSSSVFAVCVRFLTSTAYEKKKHFNFFRYHCCESCQKPYIPLLLSCFVAFFCII